MSEIILRDVQVRKGVTVILEKNDRQIDEFVEDTVLDNWKNVTSIDSLIEEYYKKFRFDKVKNKPFFELKNWNDDEYSIEFDITNNNSFEGWLESFFPNVKLDEDEDYNIIVYQNFSVKTINIKEIDDDSDDWVDWNREPEHVSKYL